MNEEKRYLETELVEVEGEKLIVASTDDEDRHGEIVVQEGIDLANYKKNPKILAFHDHRQPELGIAERLGFKTIDGKKKLVFDPKFHGKTELSRLYKELKEEGYPIATSIGFIAKEFDDNKITKSELLEISIVNIPANPAALSLAYAKGFSDETIREAMPEAWMEAKIKEVENKFNEKIANLEKKITPSQEPIKPELGTGRNPKHSVKNSRLAIKTIYKALEILGKETK